MTPVAAAHHHRLPVYHSPHTGWNDSPAPLIARHLSLSRCSFWFSPALMLLYQSSAIFSSEIHYLLLRWSIKAQYLWSWENGRVKKCKKQVSFFFFLSLSRRRKKNPLFRSKCRNRPGNNPVCSAAELHFNNTHTQKQEELRALPAFFLSNNPNSLPLKQDYCLFPAWISCVASRKINK